MDPWVSKSPWRKKWQLTVVFLPGDPIGRGAGQATVHRVTKELGTTLLIKNNNKNGLSEVVLTFK